MTGRSPKVPIAILGAGPAGLTFARLLQLNNIEYIIFERDVDASVMQQGGSLDIHGDSGQVALKEAGLFEQFKAAARYDSQTTTIADKFGKVAVKLCAEGMNNDRPEIDRKALRALLLDSVPKDKIRWGRKVNSVAKEEGGSMSVHFADGSVESGYRLVVGADGAWSKARSLVTSAKPVYTGHYYFQSAISATNPHHPAVEELVGLGTYMATGSGKDISAQRNGDRSYMIAAGIDLPERWLDSNADLVADTPALRDWLVGHFSDFADVNADLLRNSERTFRPWPFYEIPPESLCWETVPGVALLGDAAHLSTPYGGEGVNQALFDSYQLAQHIVKRSLDDLPAAVADYEKEMFPRTAAVITDSRNNMKMLLAPDAPESWVRAMGLGEAVDDGEAADKE